MSSMLGETQSRELLCDEADKLLGELEGKEDPKMQLAAFEHERLTTCLDMLEQLHLGFFNRRADKGRIVWTIDSGRKLVDVCKSYRKY